MMRVLEGRLFVRGAGSGSSRTHEEVEKSVHSSLEHGGLGALGEYVKAGAVPLGLLRTCRIMCVVHFFAIRLYRFPIQCTPSLQDTLSIQSETIAPKKFTFSLSVHLHITE
jgi:hypothetical protein